MYPTEGMHVKFGRYAATVLGGTVLVVGLAPAAQAIPESCVVTVSGHTAASRCAAGTGEHQVRVRFRFANPQIPGDMWFFGPWAPVGAASEVYLPLGGSIVHSEVGKR
jgi:hypothetical protein